MAAVMERMEIRSHYLHPGNLFAHAEPHLVTTILGSCIAVCLWDPILSIGGINHYMLPLWNGSGLPEPKYGNIAIRKLIEKMEFYGSRREDLEAKVFGGASVNRAGDLINVGRKNIVLVKDMLPEEGVRIVASDMGGNRGRRLLFDTGTGKVKVRLIKSSAQIRA